MKDLKIVGKSVTKIDALSLALGQPMFTDDIELKDMLHAKILWSPYAHARIKDIDISEAEALPGVHLVLCYKNVPRVMHTTVGASWPEAAPYDTPVFDSKVRYVGDRVAAVAAETEEIAEKALKLIKVEYEPLPTILDPEKAMEKDAPVIHDEPDCKFIIPVFYDPKRNHVAHLELKVGDFDKGLKEADFVAGHKFKTHYGQHCALEPHICIGYIDHYGRLVLRTSTQVPFHTRREVAQCLQIPERMIRVIKPRIGGGFGSKQEMVVEDVCGMLTWRTKRPVRLSYNREETFVSSRTRHPMVMWAQAGAKKDGTLTALKLKVLSNTGAYGTHGMTVMNNACVKVLPLYKCDNLEFNGDVVYTNMPVAGAYRGYGVFQGNFAVAATVDELAAAIGMDPVDFWLKNTIKQGESSPIFAKLSERGEGVAMKVESCSLPECIKKGAEAFGWHEKRKKYKDQPEGRIRYGIGMACMGQGGSVAHIDMASAYAKINDDGSFNLLVGATDLGTGSDTTLAQIFAETLDMPIEDIIVLSSDTDLTPFDKGAYASSTCYVSGEAVRKCAEEVKKQILKVASEMLEEPQEHLKLENKGVASTKTHKRAEFHLIAKRALHNKNQFQIAANASQVAPSHPITFAAHFAEVAVDTETGEVKVLSFIAACDCGTAINPRIVEGQIESCIANAVAYSLTEGYYFDESGRMLNPNFGRYKIFSASDMPKTKVLLVPSYEPTGPYGAKTVGEPNMNGAMPAISNAIFTAVGIRLTETPFTPDRVLRALKEKN